MHFAEVNHRDTEWFAQIHGEYTENLEWANDPSRGSIITQRRSLRGINLQEE